MRDLDTFLEKMNHEMNGNPLQLTKQGYKVDSDHGIKRHCKIDAYKSVDYFYVFNNQFKLIEFSDLWTQHSEITCQIKAIKDSNLDKKDKKELVKIKSREISAELTSKYKDSISIITVMPNYINNIPGCISAKKGDFIIVIAKPTTADNIELVRFMDKLKNDVTTSLPDRCFRFIKIDLLDNFDRTT